MLRERRGKKEKKGKKTKGMSTSLAGRLCRLAKGKGKVKVKHTQPHKPRVHLRAHTGTSRPLFSRPALALCVLRPASAAGLINWPFHLVDAHCICAPAVCVAASASLRVCMCACTRVCVCARESFWVHCLSCEVFGFLTEGCCHSL